MGVSVYPLLLIAGLAVSYALWVPRVRRDSRLLPIYGASIFGAFAGAKAVFFAAEGFLYVDHPERWLIWATGKTILGALLGGYIAVELAKKSVGYTKPTGDLFAMAAPVGIILGRVGCVMHGCCPGVPREPAWWTLRDGHGLARWPAVPMEIGFNAVALMGFLVLRHRSAMTGQHFHLYLIAYGMFRFMHEYVRDTPRVLGSLSGYHVAAVAVITLGVVGLIRRFASMTMEAEECFPKRQAINESIKGPE